MNQQRLFRKDRAIALRRAGDARPLSERLASVDGAEGRRRLVEHLKTRPYPHYEPADSPGLLIKIDSDGKRTLGRFVNRKFRVARKKAVKTDAARRRGWAKHRPSSFPHTGAGDRSQ